MVIGFKLQFAAKILAGTKIHTIREDRPGRWKKGILMHMATGVRTKHYREFARPICTGTQSIKIVYTSKGIFVYIDGFIFYASGEKFSFRDEDMLQLAQNDGFDTIEDFFTWFDKDFTGKIIHWTPDEYIC